MLLHLSWHYGTFRHEDVITFYPTELQDGEQEDCGQDSPDNRKDHVYESEIHVGLSGVCHCVFFVPTRLSKGPLCSESDWKSQQPLNALLGCEVRLCCIIYSEDIF